MTSLVLTGVAKRFGGVQAVAGVDIAIPPGSITGLIGPNGAGKTTLVNIISGQLQASAGQICLGERNLTDAPAHVVARAGIVRTFQNIRLLPETTVLENIVIGYHNHGRTSLIGALLALPDSWRESREVRDRAHTLLERFEMRQYANVPAGDLAYGHQRRVEVMRALAVGPRILMLDEPVAGMNDVEAASLGRIFSELAESGMGVLLIEHNIRFVTRLCSEVFVLDNGRVIAAGPPQSVTNDPAVVAAYLGA